MWEAKVQIQRLWLGVGWSRRPEGNFGRSKLRTKGKQKQEGRQAVKEEAKRSGSKEEGAATGRKQRRAWERCGRRMRAHARMYK